MPTPTMKWTYMYMFTLDSNGAVQQRLPNAGYVSARTPINKAVPQEVAVILDRLADSASKQTTVTRDRMMFALATYDDAARKWSQWKMFKGTSDALSPLTQSMSIA